jgi:aromatic-L-amino-acid decarboxylase
MEQSLDPGNWEELRRLGHEMVDTMLDYLRNVGERPSWQKIPAEVVDAMRQPLPMEGQPIRSVYEEFLTNVLPYNVNNVHPRFWAWVEGGGTPAGMLADLLASGMNANLAIGDQAPVYVERQVLDWSKAMFGFPSSASGILTSGGSMANITALIVARNHFSPAIKQKGLRAEAATLRVYGSEETHNCMVKGVEAIGLGGENFRRVPVDDEYRVRIDLLEEMIAADRAAGYLPFCIVGNAGTVNTGAVDDLDALATIAKREGCWLHVDGAFGAVPYIVPEWKEKLRGLERADSLSFDFHKWFYVNYEVGCVLIRDEQAHLAAFSAPASYLLKHERGLPGGPIPFSGYGLELSRGFKALKVWMLLKEHGVRAFARLVEQNLAQASFLGGLVEASPELELLTPVSMNIVCFRFVGSGGGGLGDAGGGLGDAALNELNKELLMRLHEEGIASPSYTVLRGRYAIRVAITNHRSRRGDFEVLVEGVLRLGRELVVAAAGAV